MAAMIAATGLFPAPAQAVLGDPIEIPTFSRLRCTTIEEITEIVGRVLEGWPTQWTTLRARSNGDIILLVQPDDGPIHFTFTFRDGCLLDSKAFSPNEG